MHAVELCSVMSGQLQVRLLVHYIASEFIAACTYTLFSTPGINQDFETRWQQMLQTQCQAEHCHCKFCTDECRTLSSSVLLLHVYSDIWSERSIDPASKSVSGAWACMYICNAGLPQFIRPYGCSAIYIYAHCIKVRKSIKKPCNNLSEQNETRVLLATGEEEYKHYIQYIWHQCGCRWQGHLQKQAGNI